MCIHPSALDLVPDLGSVDSGTDLDLGFGSFVVLVPDLGCFVPAVHSVPVVPDLDRFATEILDSAVNLVLGSLGSDPDLGFVHSVVVNHLDHHSDLGFGSFVVRDPDLEILGSDLVEILEILVLVGILDLDCFATEILDPVVNLGSVPVPDLVQHLGFSTGYDSPDERHSDLDLDPDRFDLGFDHSDPDPDLDLDPDRFALAGILDLGFDLGIANPDQR